MPVNWKSSVLAPTSLAAKKGVVVNIESTVQSIQRAVEEAELMAGCAIESVYGYCWQPHKNPLPRHRCYS